MTLIQEVNERWPNRHQGVGSADGTIGDAAHASRTSDHNPWVIDDKGYGVVRARDIDEDLDGNKWNGKGDANALFWLLLGKARKGDPRLNGGGYLIYEKEFFSERTKWQSEVYKGDNDHGKHLHISFSLNAYGYDSGAPWGIAQPPGPAPMKCGDKGQGPAFLASMLNILSDGGCMLDANNKRTHYKVAVPTSIVGRTQFVFTCEVHVQVENFQRFMVTMWFLAGAKGPRPEVDGIVGPQTSGAIAFWIPVVLQGL